MRTLAVIPARLGATRLPRKPLRILADLPLVIRVWERVLSLDVVDRCLIATDSTEVADVVNEYGAEVVMTSPEHRSGTDRIAEVALRREYADYDVIVNVQGDEPFVPRSAITGAARLVTDGRFPLGTAAVRADARVLRDPNVVKVVAASDGRAMYFSRAPIPFLRDAEDAPLQRPLIWQHIGVYAYTSVALQNWVSLPSSPLEEIERLEQLRPLAAGIPMGVSLTEETVIPGIDTEEDLERANREWTATTTG
jgi:3-deoxy-manno-octulosonate cytidylyltransferase (CMP-KDO synthetase)